MPQWIVIENLEIRGAHNPNTFTGPTGATETYTAPASAIYVEFGENITVRNCDMNNNGNGFFVFSSDTTPAATSWSKATPSTTTATSAATSSTTSTWRPSASRSSTTTSAPLLPGAGGNNLKDRSAGLVVRYNWIEQLQPPARSRGRRGQLAGARRSRATARRTSTGTCSSSTPTAATTRSASTAATAASAQKFRKGTLYFYNNTVVSDRTGQHAALPPVDQRREHRRAQQHRLRDGGRGPTCRCSTTTAG